VLPGQLTVIEAAQELTDRPEASGCVVSDQSRPIGWCHRGDVIAAAQDERGFASLITIADARAVCIEAQTPLAEAIDIMAAAKDRICGENSPLIVQHGGQVVGVVTRADLLRAASDALKGGQQLPPTLPTLPGRIRTDEHVARLLRFGPGSTHAGDVEVAFVDLRGFAEYNAHHGYSLGDEVLARLGAMLDHHVVRNESGIFLGHHGGDVFVLTAPPHVLASRLRTVIEIFDRSFGNAHGTNASLSQPLSLRCLVLHNVMQVAQAPRWLHRQHELLRLSEDSPRCRPNHSTISVVDASMLARRTSA
jgi:CBS domain-containing protein